MEKKHWILIGVLIAVIIIWYYFKKKKTESNYDRNKFFRVKQDLRAYSCGPGEWACGYTSSGVKCCPRGTGGGPAQANTTTCAKGWVPCSSLGSNIGRCCADPADRSLNVGDK